MSDLKKGDLTEVKPDIEEEDVTETKPNIARIDVVGIDAVET